jgi:nucleotide-binding universal stress UspA family protein
LGRDVVRAEGGSLTALRILPGEDEIDMEVEMEVLRQLVEDVLGEIPEQIIFRLKRSDSVVEGILQEAASQEAGAGYDLIAIGASEEWFLKNLLFGSIPDRVANDAPCSVLMVRKYEPPAVSWFRRMTGARQRQSAS